MKNNRNALKAGSFILISVIVAGVLIVAVAKSTIFTPASQTRYVDFALADDLGGLQVGDDVRVGGFKVGQVTGIEIVSAEADARTAASTQPAEAPHIRVSFTFPSRYALRESAMLRIQGTLTGTSWLNFESLGAGQTVAPSVALVGHPSSFSEILASVSAMRPPLQDILTTVQRKTLPTINDAVANFRDTGAHTSKLTADLRDQVQPVVAHYNTLTEHATAAVDKVGGFFGDGTTDFRQTLASAAKLTKAFADKMPAILDKAATFVDHIDQTVQRATAALQDVQTTVANTKDISDSVKSVLVNNKSKLDSMIGSLKTASDNLKFATSEIRHAPWRLLYKPHPGEVQNLNVFDAARQFSDGAGELDDAAAALRDALNHQNVDKAQVEQLMARLQKSFEKFQSVEQELWTKVKE